MDAAFGAVVSGSFVLGHVLAGASDLMMTLLVVASSAGVPEGHVVTTRVTIVLIVVEFVGVGRLLSAVVAAGRLGRWWWDARWELCWWWSGVGVTTITSAATIIVVASATVVAWIVGRGCRWGYGRSLHGEECNLLLGCCKGCADFRYARECRLVVGIVRDLEITQLVVECRFDVGEGVVVGDGIGGSMISVCGHGSGTRLFTDNVCGGEVGLQCIPRAGCCCHSIPLNDRLAEHTRKLNCHDGSCYHLLHGEGRRCDDGRHITVFKAVKICLDGFGGIPRRSELCVVGVAFRRGWISVGGTECQEDGPGVMITAVCCSANEGTPRSGSAPAECPRDGYIKRCDDGACDGGLCLVCRFGSNVRGFGVSGFCGIEPELPMLAGVGRVGPGNGGLKCILGGLFG